MKTAKQHRRTRGPNLGPRGSRVTLKCEFCEKPFTVELSQANTAKYCSKSCANSGRFRRKLMN